MIIRPAASEDAAALVEILNEIISAGGTTAIERPLSRSEFGAHYLHGDRFLACYVAVEPSRREPTGFQALERHPDLPENWADIGTFARMRPKIKGVGTALFSETRKRARELGLAAINAAIRADNTGGLAYYEKMGFTTYKTLRAIPLNDGTPIDRILKRYDVA
ncbi:GNAT family N-acetyltransferase [Bosea vaviloviae]|uniref:GNAT family N-acetyltransferase n=1 Tax=Bosea vaviloviae TaxID=1526658 RepID=A0A1D7U9K6_9HYPH|nr:GNAT family N-acetyltransferase [Bosea vaviloviae]AOO84066.1 GNAT family N-acetyltransferase [Bosea vaviloviae]